MPASPPPWPPLLLLPQLEFSFLYSTPSVFVKPNHPQGLYFSHRRPPPVPPHHLPATSRVPDTHCGYLTPSRCSIFYSFLGCPVLSLFSAIRSNPPLPPISGPSCPAVPPSPAVAASAQLTTTLALFLACLIYLWEGENLKSHQMNLIFSLLNWWWIAVKCD